MFILRHENKRTCFFEDMRTREHVFFKTEVSVGGTVSEPYHVNHSIAPYYVITLIL